MRKTDRPGRQSTIQLLLSVPAGNIMRAMPDAEPPTKAALTRYFTVCTDACLEHLVRRPLTLVRHVDGLTFFRKGRLPPCSPAVHKLGTHKADGTRGIRLWVDDLAGLLGPVEIDVVEMHPWGATVDDIERPDKLIFDRDPDDDVPWMWVKEAALGVVSQFEI